MEIFLRLSVRLAEAGLEEYRLMTLYHPIRMNTRYESGYRLWAETGLVCWWAELVIGMIAPHSAITALVSSERA